jgi:hypothetical protein
MFSIPLQKARLPGRGLLSYDLITGDASESWHLT